MYSIRFDLDLGVKYLIGCDATADVDDVLISWSWTYFVLCSKSKIPDHVLYRIGPRSAPWRIGYDPANAIGGNQRRRDTLLFPWKTWFPSLTKCGILFYITYI